MKFCWLVLTLTLSVPTQALTLDASKGKTEFLAIGRPAALKINGKGSGPTGELFLTRSGEDFLLNGNAEVDVSSFNTGISMRDRHMKETYLEVEKFKTATLSFVDIKVAKKLIDEGGTVTVKGGLNFHGVDAPINIDLSLKSHSDELATMAKFKIDLATFGVQVPTYAGVTVANDVTVTTETKFSKAELKL